MLKIAFISGVTFGHQILEHILENGWKISIVFSHDDSKKELYSDFSSFDDVSKKFKIQNIKVQNINDKENVELLNSLKPDLILVMGWSQILKSEIICTPKIGIIGSHPTELPKFRGRAPIPWTILKGLKESAETFFWIEKGIDDGDIVDQKKFRITENDDASSVYQKVTELGKEMIIENLKKIDIGIIPRKKQDPSKFLEYWKKRNPEDGIIDWNKTAKEIILLFRATTYPYPGAFTYFKNSKLIIWKAEILENNLKDPGKILKVSNDGVHIGTGKGIISLKLVGEKKKKEISSNEYFFEKDEGLKLG